MILITRPKENNFKTYSRLKSKKIVSRSEPVFKIKYLNKTLNPETKKIFVVVSSNAIKVIQRKKNLERIKKSVFVVVGKKSKLELKRLGFNVRLVAKDAAELLKQIRRHRLHKENSFEYLSSNIYNKQFMSGLIKLNKGSKKNVIYNLVPNISFSKATLNALIENKIKVVLFFSKFSCRIFFKICKSHKISKKILREMHFIALSKKIAEKPIEDGYAVSWSKMPEMEKLIDMAVKHYSKF